MQPAITSRSGGEFGNVRYTQAQLDQFLAAHERFQRREPRGRRAVMKFLSARGLDFSRRLLADADFTGADLREARLVLANFERAALYCADLRSADARGANLHRADLRGCCLRDANLSGARLDQADMREAILAREDQEKEIHLGGWSGGPRGRKSRYQALAVDFTNCSMKGAKLAQSKLKGANFSGALLKGADLSGAVLDGARFDGAVLIDVDMTGASIDPAALANCVLPPSQSALQRIDELKGRLAAADRWRVTDGAEGRPAVLDREDLRILGAVFETARLTALSARHVCAIGVSFKGAQLQAANFEGADLRDADFSGADLRGACLRDANLSHARFKGADLRPLVLPSGDRPVDLEGATYQESALTLSLRD
jgi:uncharacterized protein YjbI with pentapeptide repeats